MPFCCGAFLCECYGCSNQPQMKTNDPVGTLLDTYDYNILMIDSVVSLTSFFDLEYTFRKFSCKLSWTRSQFFGTWAESDSKCFYLDTVFEIMEQNKIVVELGLLGLHSDERSSKVREYLCCNFVFLLTPTWRRNIVTSERRLRLLLTFKKNLTQRLH